jgi:F-type H+-transporting ATPase subunit b
MAPQTVLADGGNFLVPNATFFAELIAFALILGILGRYVLPPVQKAMRERQAIINKQIEDSEAARRKLAEAQEEYQRALTEARTQAAQIRDNARMDAQRIVDEMVARAQEESARVVARGEELLAKQRQATVRELRAEIGTLAVELASRIVGESLADEARRRATVDRFLAELEQADHASGTATGRTTAPSAAAGNGAGGGAAG